MPDAPMPIRPARTHTNQFNERQQQARAAETEPAAEAAAAADPAAAAATETDSETKSVVRRGSTRAHFWTRKNPANQPDFTRSTARVVMVLSLEGA
jgi:hypothetical protein